MKKILTAIALVCFCMSAFAQAGSLRVRNNTNCIVFYVVRAGAAGSCAFGISSTLISLPPGASITYATSAAVPGLSAGLFLNAVLLYIRPPACGPTDTNLIGEPCTGLAAIWNYPIYNTACTLCDISIAAQWVPAPMPGGQATLTFI